MAVAIACVGSESASALSSSWRHVEWPFLTAETSAAALTAEGSIRLVTDYHAYEFAPEGGPPRLKYEFLPEGTESRLPRDTYRLHPVFSNNGSDRFSALHLGCHACRPTIFDWHEAALIDLPSLPGETGGDSRILEFIDLGQGRLVLLIALSGNRGDELAVVLDANTARIVWSKPWTGAPVYEAHLVSLGEQRALLHRGDKNEYWIISRDGLERVVPTGRPEYVGTIAMTWDPASRRLAALAGTGELQLFDSSMRLLSSTPDVNGVAAAFSDRGRALTAAGGGFVNIYDVSSDIPVLAGSIPHMLCGSGPCLEFRAAGGVDSSEVYLAERNPRGDDLLVIDTRTRSMVQSLETGDTVAGLLLSPDRSIVGHFGAQNFELLAGASAPNLPAADLGGCPGNGPATYPHEMRIPEQPLEGQYVVVRRPKEYDGHWEIDDGRSPVAAARPLRYEGWGSAMLPPPPELAENPHYYEEVQVWLYPNGRSSQLAECLVLWYSTAPLPATSLPRIPALILAVGLAFVVVSRQRMLARHQEKGGARPPGRLH